MVTEEQVLKVFEEGSGCDNCSHFQWGPGGPDPCGCDIIEGKEGTELDDCPCFESED